MTCHNRRDTTVTCLDALMNQQAIDDVRLQTYLVDAGSTDGTAEVIEERFPDIRVIRRDSSLYWCGGTRAAFGEAMKGDYDYYLWLNDDTVLLSDAIRVLLKTARDTEDRDGRPGIVVGSTLDPQTGRCTYGGVVRSSKWRPLTYRLIEPSGKAEPCNTINGNCVLIPREVAQSVGNMSPEFTHKIGDRDYGLRAKAKGIPLWVAPSYVGECSRNPPPPWADPAIPLKERLKNLRSPKGLPPREWTLYARRHAGIQWPLYWFTLYMRVLMPGLWRWLGK